jgi:hypothetical protein
LMKRALARTMPRRRQFEKQVVNFTGGLWRNANSV